MLSIRGIRGLSSTETREGEGGSWQAYLRPIAQSLELIVGVAVRGCCADALGPDDEPAPADAAGALCCGPRPELIHRRDERGDGKWRPWKGDVSGG